MDKAAAVRTTDPSARPTGQVDLRRQLPLHVTWLLGLALTYLSWLDMGDGLLGRDSHAYWAAWQGPGLYANPPGSLDAFNYSPAFAQLVWPLAQLPWPVFGVVWALATVAGLVVLLRPLGWRWVPPLLLCCTPEIASGNVFWVLALVAAYGLRHPALWTFPLLTKLTPGLGPVWFAVRREWRPLAVSLAVTAAIVVASYAVAPAAWADWLDFLGDHSGRTADPVGTALLPPLLVRLPVALGLVVWGARSDRRWVLPVAMVLATPVTGIAALTILTAIPRLRQRQLSP